MTDHDDGRSGFPTTLLVEHGGYATVQALAFERLWESALPFDYFVATRGGGTER